MADTGWKTAGTIVSSTGITNPNNIGASDNTYATLSGSTFTELILRNFNFNIPVDAIVTKVSLRAEGYVNWDTGTYGSGAIEMSYLFDDGTGDISLIDFNTATSSVSHDEVESSIDVDGNVLSGDLSSLTTSQVNSSDFGIWLNVGNGGAVGTQYVDYIAIKITYLVGTEVNDTRNALIVGKPFSKVDAMIVGKQTANATRNATLLGGVQSTRSAILSGIGYSNTTVGARLIGKNLTNDIREFYLVGKATSYAAIGATLTGQKPNSIRVATITGKSSEYSKIDAIIFGKETANALRNGFITGKLSDYSSIGALTIGQNSGFNKIDARLIGGVSSNRGARISGNYFSDQITKNTTSMTDIIEEARTITNYVTDSVSDITDIVNDGQTITNI